METTLQPGIIWDDTKTLFEQAPATFNLVLPAIQVPPAHTVTEPCLNGKTRATQLIYTLNNNFNIKVNPVYSNPPQSRHFMGISDLIISIISK